MNTLRILRHIPFSVWTLLRSIPSPARWAMRLSPVALSVVLALAPVQRVEAVGITLDKLVNGVTADFAPGPSVAVGSTVTFTYVLTDPGLFFISSITIIDDNGTSTPSDDFAPTFISGDTNGNAALDISEIWTYSATALAIAGQYSNFAIANGVSFDPISPGQSVLVSGADLGHYFGVADGQQVAEPATLVLLAAAGVAGLGYRCRKRRPQH
jgi:hypothetical protein